MNTLVTDLAKNGQNAIVLNVLWISIKTYLCDIILDNQDIWRHENLKVLVLNMEMWLWDLNKRIILLFHFHIHVRMGLHLDLNLARESVIGLNSTWGVVHFLFWLLLDYASSNWSEKCPLYIFILFSLSFNVIYNYEIHLHS